MARKVGDSPARSSEGPAVASTILVFRFLASAPTLDGILHALAQYVQEIEVLAGDAPARAHAEIAELSRLVGGVPALHDAVESGGAGLAPHSRGGGFDGRGCRLRRGARNWLPYCRTIAAADLSRAVLIDKGTLGGNAPDDILGGQYRRHLATTFRRPRGLRSPVLAGCRKGSRLKPRYCL